MDTCRFLTLVALVALGANSGARGGEAEDLPPAIEPMLSDVFTRGQGTYPAYRIPSVVVTKKGTVLAFAEGRQSLHDHAENNIILRRSTDNGKTWGTLIVVHHSGRDVLVNPCAVVLDSGRALVMYQHFPAGYHARASGKIKRLTPGIQGDTVSTTLVVHSDDDGATWSKPRDVTAGAKRPTTVNSTASGPGIGVVLRRGTHKGRILMPTNEGWWVGDSRTFNVYACFSDDGGETWRYGEPAPRGAKGHGNEVQMVELADGRVMLNSRSNGGTRHRKTAVSADGGLTWSELKDELQHPEPQCMGSILRYAWPTDGGKSRILFANPGSQKGRRNGVVRMSYDEGKTWPVAKTLYAGGYAYSCLTVLADGSIGCLFERDGYRVITFARFTLGQLTGGKDKTE